MPCTSTASRKGPLSILLNTGEAASRRTLWTLKLSPLHVMVRSECLPDVRRSFSPLNRPPTRLFELVIPSMLLIFGSFVGHMLGA